MKQKIPMKCEDALKIEEFIVIIQYGYSFNTKRATDLFVEILQ